MHAARLYVAETNFCETADYAEEFSGKRTVWNDLNTQATNQNAAGFNATIGTFVPNTVQLQPIPSRAAAPMFLRCGHAISQWLGTSW